MAPLLFGFRSYTVLLAVAIVSATLLALWSATRSNLRLARFAAWDAVLLAMSLLGAKLYAIVEYGSVPTSLEEFSNTGLRLSGGVLGLVAGGLLMAARSTIVSVWQMADVVAPSFALGLTISRIGCFLNGCCTGSLCALPWGVSFPRGSRAWRSQVGDRLISVAEAQSLSVHPLQLYLAFLGVSVAIGLVLYTPRKRFDGEIFLLWLIAHGIGKALLESLRHPWEAHLQLGAMGMAIFGASGFFLIACKRWLKPARK